MQKKESSLKLLSQCRWKIVFDKVSVDWWWLIFNVIHCKQTWEKELLYKKIRVKLNEIKSRTLKIAILI